MKLTKYNGKPVMKNIQIQSQHGAALLVSLVILLVLTVLGISAMSTSSMENRMSQNFQLENTAFQLTESALKTVLIRGDKSLDSYDTDVDIFDNALDDPTSTPTTNLPTSILDPNNHLKVADPSADAKVEFVAYVGMCPGGNACNKYRVTTTVDIPGTSATTTHVQYVQIPVAPITQQ
jgi:hypothetical protein